MIAKKVRVFKDFSGWVFPEKMQVIHRLDALCREVVHNILWFVGKSGTSFPGSMRLFLHFRVKMCGIAHSVFSGKILRSGKCTGKRRIVEKLDTKKGLSGFLNGQPLAMRFFLRETGGFKQPGHSRNCRLRLLRPSFFEAAHGTLGDFRPGNGIVAQALLSVSRRSASLFRPQGALGSSPPNP